MNQTEVPSKTWGGAAWRAGKQAGRGEGAETPKGKGGGTREAALMESLNTLDKEAGGAARRARRESRSGGGWAAKGRREGERGIQRNIMRTVAHGNHASWTKNNEVSLCVRRIRKNGKNRKPHKGQRRAAMQYGYADKIKGLRPATAAGTDTGKWRDYLAQQGLRPPQAWGGQYTSGHTHT